MAQLAHLIGVWESWVRLLFLADSATMDRRLVDHLVNSDLVSRAAMQRMILRASKDKSSIVEQLLADDKIDEQSLARELASYYGLGLVTPAKFSVNETALRFISKSMADKHGVLPFAVSDAADHVTVAVYNPESAQSVLESLKTATGREPSVQVAPRAWLHKAIRHFYFGDSWAEAPAHKAATREVSDVSADYGLADVGMPMEESSEIVLDEVIVPPAPKPRPKRAAPEPAEEPAPPPRQKRGEQQQKQKAQQVDAAPRGRSRSGADADSEVDQALDEFDAFLDQATGWGNRSGSSGIPGWDDDADAVDPFSLKATAGAWQEPDPMVARNGASGFNLFDEKSEAAGSVQALVEEHTDLIERLRRELQQQRDIITALVDALADAGVVSKREIKHRVKRK